MLRYSIDHGVTWLEAEEVRIEIDSERVEPAVVLTTATREGLIIDTVIEDNIIKSRAIPWEDLATTEPDTAFPTAETFLEAAFPEGRMIDPCDIDFMPIVHPPGIYQARHRKDRKLDSISAEDCKLSLDGENK